MARTSFLAEVGGKTKPRIKPEFRTEIAGINMDEMENDESELNTVLSSFGCLKFETSESRLVCERCRLFQCVNVLA